MKIHSLSISAEVGAVAELQKVVIVKPPQCYQIGDQVFLYAGHLENIDADGVQDAGTCVCLNGITPRI
ncbi:hypothetical protein RB195_005632 [Necator americanus]|uniref:Uncharacterized protein n=1 Tax=Necator americanus TaxID=51031 RepID=A0ABR1BNU8_NECAM